MTDPLDTNDEWAELARELDRDKPPVPPADMVEHILDEQAVEPHHGADARVEEEAVAEGETEGETAEDFEDAEESPAGEATAEGEQPGAGRKRRRRRRRRRKGGAAPTEGAATPGEDADGETASEAETDEEAAEPVAEADEFAAAEDVNGEAVPLAADEDTASEVLRELIATWNVPSWDEIVGGLYRPN
ncbi:MAG: hypothetical protein J0I06_25780 [Planctomycetes bacterium]|nr:hypothetical protein [Planctomycetota bacterium]